MFKTVIQAKKFSKSVAIVLILPCLLASGCTSQENALRLFVASSMTDFMGQISSDHSTTQPATVAEINIAGSGTLLTQLDEGAEADVVILAGRGHMRRLQEMDSFLSPVEFASTSLSVVVSPELATASLSIRDLKAGELQGAACVVSAPCGQLAEQFAAAKGLELRSWSREPNVRSVLAKVERGEVDFGFVYRTDFLAAETDIAEIADSGAEAFTTFYSLAVARDTPNMTKAVALVEFITSHEGQSRLRQLGFEVP